MLNEEHVKLMIKVAVYEKKEGKKILQGGNYFRSDYIGMYMLKSFLYTTLAVAIVAGIYLYYHFETLLEDVYTLDLVDITEKVIGSYAIVVVIFSVITYIVYAYRYGKIKGWLKNYRKDLKIISRFYNKKTTDLE